MVGYSTHPESQDRIDEIQEEFTLETAQTENQRFRQQRFRNATQGLG